LLEYAGVARIFLERRDLGDEARRLFDLLEREHVVGTAGECVPPLDVLETASTPPLKNWLFPSGDCRKRSISW